MGEGGVWLVRIVIAAVFPVRAGSSGVIGYRLKESGIVLTIIRSLESDWNLVFLEVMEFSLTVDFSNGVVM